MVSQYLGNPQLSDVTPQAMVATNTASPESVVRNSISLAQSREKLQEKAFGSLTFLNSNQNGTNASVRPQSGGG